MMYLETLYDDIVLLFKENNIIKTNHSLCSYQIQDTLIRISRSLDFLVLRDLEYKDIYYNRFIFGDDRCFFQFLEASTIVKTITYNEFISNYEDEDYRFNLSLLYNTKRLEKFMSDPIFDKLITIIAKNHRGS